ncbi:unnamed protein product [Phytophthora fragariaefolia]|uniref:Unnamed protein product n=1 Tax=Phytophthora fragariaefolia TaxID=1490495 RepID=A0A9W7CQM6_9STRA|nr:unnamed protein product [Phytophthora fragariaefolia]
MHCTVKDQRLKQRLLNKRRERGENLVNFTVGDFVLRSRVDVKHANKLQVVWVGPYRVVRADAHSFRVQHLVTGDELDVHASRLKTYADDSLEVTDELLEHISAQGILLSLEALKDHRWNDDMHDYDVFIGWKGLEAIEDSYEPLSELAKEIRVPVDNYVRGSGDSELLTHWESRAHGREQVTAPRGPSAATSNAGAPPGDTQPARRRQTGKKRRHRTPGGPHVQMDDARSRPAEDRQSPAGDRVGQAATGSAGPAGRQTKRSRTAVTRVTAITRNKPRRSTRLHKDRG